jgi:hypothetical protein
VKNMMHKWVVCREANSEPSCRCFVYAHRYVRVAVLEKLLVC